MAVAASLRLETQFLLWLPDLVVARPAVAAAGGSGAFDSAGVRVVAVVAVAPGGGHPCPPYRS